MRRTQGLLERLLPSWEPAARYGLVAVLALAALGGAECASGHSEPVKARLVNAEEIPGHDEPTYCTETEEDEHGNSHTETYQCGTHWVESTYSVDAVAQTGERLHIECSRDQYAAARADDEIDATVHVGGIIGIRVATWP